MLPVISLPYAIQQYSGPVIISSSQVMELYIYKRISSALHCILAFVSRVTMGDDVYNLFDSQPCTEPLYQPKGGTTYLFKWDDDKWKHDWRVDGYRWRQNGAWRGAGVCVNAKRSCDFVCDLCI